MIIIQGYKVRQCPFCGSNMAPEITTDQDLLQVTDELYVEIGGVLNYPSYIVVCNVNSGGCGGCGGYGDTIEKAVDHWNRRK